MSFSLLTPDPKKKKSLPGRFPVIFPILIFALLLIGYQFVGDAYIHPAIGVVELNGIILESEGTIKKLRQLENNPAIKGIIVHINSPGGAVSPSQEIFSELLRIKQIKKVYTSVSSTAASGGYYVALASDKIFANPGSMVGSIGVIIQTFNVEGLMKKIGIKSEVIKSGKNKDIGSMFREMKADEKTLLQNVISDTHEQFITAVAENRPLKLKQVRKLADGRIFTGNQAKDIGLIDEIASFRQTVQQMQIDLNIDRPIELVYPDEKQELFNSLIDLESMFGLKKLLNQSGLYYLAPSLLEK